MHRDAVSGAVDTARSLKIDLRAMRELPHESATTAPVAQNDGKRVGAATIMPFAGAFLFFCFFPYVQIVPTASDLQPYAFVMSLAVCLAARGGLPREVWLFAASSFAALVLWLIDDRSFFGFREFLTFLSLTTVTAAAVSLSRTRHGWALLRRYVVFATFCWLIVGLVERLAEPSMMSALIPNTSLDPGRGVTGLATEPSFYGIYCLCLLGLNYLCNNGNRIVSLALLFQIVVLAQSSIAVLLLVIFAIYWLIFFVSPKNLVLASLAVLAILWILADLLPQFRSMRIAQLPLDFIGDPWVVLETDASLNARLGHSLFSLLGFADNWGAPHGFDHFHEYVGKKLSEVDYVWLGRRDPGIKIMSGYGAALFELGVFGLPIPVAVAFAIKRHFRGHTRVAIFVVCYVTTVLFSAIQLSLPLLGLMLGVLLATSRVEPHVDTASQVTRDETV
ncbi:hypothetical protein [Burkholderia sp. BDU5]|uniref:hypothetical protein n=1 Tax=Burkholderia sp. BDU5 TaxID=1385590 RepID=UPI0012E3AD31|nr:hypothetical protein [Burkholderia sp. BDU5]